MMLIRTCTLLLVLLAAGVPALCAPPYAMTYQGTLQQPDGRPVTDGAYDLSFGLFTALTGGDPLGAVTLEDVQTASGVFTVLLDFGGLFDGSERFLQIAVRPGADTGAFETLAPRQPVAAVPHAIHALNAAQLGGLEPGRYIRYSESGNAGIGIPDPPAPTSAKGTFWVQGDSLPLPTQAERGIGIGYIDSKLSEGLFVYAGYIFAADHRFVGIDDWFVPRNLALNHLGGNVGIGTLVPSSKLEVRGNVTFDSGDPGPTLYTAKSDSPEMNRYLHLINSLSHPSASGLKAGGVLVSDSYAFANPAKNDLIVKGKVGIGSAAPNHSLRIGPTQTFWTAGQWYGGIEMENAMAMAWRPNGAGNSFGIGQSSGGLYFVRSTSPPGVATSAAYYDIVVSDFGNVGIGTTNPNVGKLQVLSAGNGVHASGAWGVLGFGQGPSTVGVYGENPSSNAYGVYGKATGTPSAGVYGTNFGAGPGVHGNGAGNNQGVYGASQSGQGVYGISSTWHGVYGYSTTSTGVEGVSANFDGVLGTSHSATAAGVSGHNTKGGYAGYFGGKVHVNGLLTKNAGAFKIDHPLDPENKYLSHSFVESPDMMNIYNGNATTDSSGDAVVVLPDYFEALNRDFRYQLTVIGQFAQAIVSSEISNNQFAVKTDRPNVKVSWQVTGIRRDAYANMYPVVVEEPKPPSEVGAYLAPEAFGQPLARASSAARSMDGASDGPEPVALPAGLAVAH